MKKIIAILLIGSVLYTCKTDSTLKEKEGNGYIISGQAPGIYNGIRVYLQENGERGRKINKDTAIVMNERFTFEGKVATPQLWVLSINSVKGNIPIIVENKNLTVQVDKDNLNKSVISGSKANEDLTEYGKKIQELGEQRVDLGNKIRSTTDETEKNQLNSEFAALNEQMANLPTTYIKENKNSLYALVLLDNLVKSRDADLKNLSVLFDDLDTSIKNTEFGAMVNNRLKAKKMQQSILGATEIGKPAPDFTAPTPDGQLLNLKDALGKVTIIDFWAAWCGPCRRENPNVVKIYNKYHSKGLEIIGVSLDGSDRQKDPKEAWLNAIEQDKLTWNHVSNLSYFNDPIARAYNITSIPATLILDEKGTIIAKNLRGAQLENKIAELLD